MPMTEQQARHRVRELRAIYVNLTWFVIVNVLLIAINLITSPDDLWFYWVTLFWGLAIVLQLINIKANFFGRNWEDKKVAELTRK